MEIYKMKKNNITTTKKIMTITLGGLLFSAPFAAFAADSTDGTQAQKVEISNEEHLEFVKASLDLQIDHANELINSVDSDFDTQRLEEIVTEYAELEEFLDTVEVETMLKEELRETFFKFKEEAKELSKEFKEIIQSAFSEEERVTLREEFRAEKELLKEEFNIPDKKENKHKKGPKFTLEQISMIDESIAESILDEEITLKEGMSSIKEIIDSMSEDERKELFTELGFEKQKNKEIRKKN